MSKGNELTVATKLSSDELTSFLQQSGWAEKASGESIPRLKLDGTTITTPDGEMFVYNPARPKIPAMTVRIVQPPEEYWAVWIDDSVAAGIGMPELAGSFSKKFIKPDPSRKVWPSDEAFDTIRNTPNLFNKEGKQVKPSWKADMLVQIIPESGSLKGDEPIYVLTLSTTSVIEFKGTSKGPDTGSVSDTNFIQKLCNMAMEQALKANSDPKKAVIDALTSLTLGGVAAEVRMLRAENKDLGRSWTVVSFDPVHIEPMQEGDFLLDAGDEDAS